MEHNGDSLKGPDWSFPDAAQVLCSCSPLRSSLLHALLLKEEALNELSLDGRYMDRAASWLPSA